MDNFVINGNIVITNVVRVDTNIFKRARVTFYYITDSTNKVKVPSGKSPIWMAVLNSYIQQSSSQQFLLPTADKTAPIITDQLLLRGLVIHFFFASVWFFRHTAEATVCRRKKKQKLSSMQHASSVIRHLKTNKW
uniref:Uncharacterized protein n=1 Tax=Pseudo-nitzschia australis TaxID=44445 RepID=A0A7S4APZ4_9STRA